MKKNLGLGIIGLGALFALTTGVKAETIDLTNVSSSSQTVTVGEVEAPIYSVDIEWGDLSYNYVYNEVTEKYEWTSKIDCMPLTENMQEMYEAGELDLYGDAACTKSVGNWGNFEDVVGNMYYGTIYTSEAYGEINITDNSTNGRVIPSISWESKGSYNYVIGKFKYFGATQWCEKLDEGLFNSFVAYGEPIYSDLNCDTLITEENPTFKEGYYGRMEGPGWKDMEYGEIPGYADAGSSYGPFHYSSKLILENDPTKEIITPKSGDVIGTITVNIAAK